MSDEPTNGAVPARVLAAICREHWAIEPSALETILEVARREADLRAVEARLGRPLAHSYAVTVRDGVAVLPVHGPIFRYANLFTEMSGASSIQLLARDLRQALDDPQIKAVLLDVDSPGGQMAGTAEFAQMVRDGTAVKPVVAYAGDGAASAAYWIASAASRLTIGRTAGLGSIGVVAGLRTTRDPERVEIVSSQSPRKRVDVGTDEGRAEIQAMVDRLAQEFVADVARFRGVAAETVLADFGAGGMLIGADAVAAGMADAVGSFEQVLAELAAASAGPTSSNRAAAAATKEKDRMTDGTEAATAASPAVAAAPLTAERVAAEHPAIADLFRGEGAKAERERVLALVQAGDDAPGHAAAVRAAIEDGKSSAGDLALSILAAERETRATRLGQMAAADDKVKVPASGTATGDAASDAAANADPLSDEALKARWDGNADLRAEFEHAGGFKAFAAGERARIRGNVRVLSRRAEGARA